MFNFAEQIPYRLPSKGPHHDPDGNMGARWVEATFLGYNRSSNTYILSTKDGIATARSLSCNFMPNMLSHEALASLQSTPCSGRQRPTPIVRFHEPAAENDEQPDVAVPGHVGDSG